MLALILVGVVSVIIVVVVVVGVIAFIMFRKSDPTVPGERPED